MRNKYIIKENTIIILTDKNEEILIDKEDLIIIEKYNYWYVTNGYARASVMHTKKGYQKIHMHRLILKPKDNELTDHINNNRSDNRKENLRVASSVTNQYNVQIGYGNSSGFKGVCKKNGCKNYTAKITYNKIEKYLGNFKDPVEAAKAYDKAAIKYHKEFALLNFPITGEIK